MIICTLFSLLLLFAAQILCFRDQNFYEQEDEQLPLLFSTEDDGFLESDFEQMDNHSVSSWEMESGRRKKRWFYEEKSVSKVLSPSRRYGLLCPLCIMMDAQFIIQYGSKDLEFELKKMVDKASWIFRATDWDNDGKPDNIGFELYQVHKNWKLDPDEDLVSYSVPRDAIEMLRRFGRDESYASACCIAIGLTMKPLLERRAAASLIASRKVMGGICETRLADPAEKIASMNLVLITGAGPANEQNLDLEQLTMVLVHELGHSFGGRHDNSAEASQGTVDDERIGRLIALRECSGYKPRLPINDTKFYSRRQVVEPPNGRFIMWSQGDTARKKFRSNNFLFSDCSKRSIATVLQSGRTSCFVRDDLPFCGNGIREAGEECDRGIKSNSEEKKCCGSRQSSSPCKILIANESCSRFAVSEIGELRTTQNESSSASRARLSNQETNLQLGPDALICVLGLGKILSIIILNLILGKGCF